VADSAGRFGPIFLASGDYGVQLKDVDGVLLWAQDPVASSTTVAATTTVSGTVELATTAEALVGSDTARVPPVSAVTEMIQQGFMYGTVGGTANAITITPSRTPSALAAGMVAIGKMSSGNSGATTLNYAGLGAIAVKVLGGAGLVACVGGEIVAGNTYVFTYSATDSAWVLEGDFAERISPQTVDDTALAIALVHAGRTIYHSSATPRTYTIPANASVAFPIGTVIKIINGPGAGTITLAITTDTLQRGDGIAGTGSRSILASSVCAIEKIAATTWIIYGTFS
jgi:hypothetical protein